MQRNAKNFYRPVTVESLKELIIENGHAINANNGQCGLIEDHLCKVSSLLISLLDQVEGKALAGEILASWPLWEAEAGELAQREQDNDAGERVMVDCIHKAIFEHSRR